MRDCDGRAAGGAGDIWEGLPAQFCCTNPALKAYFKTKQYKHTEVDTSEEGGKEQEGVRPQQSPFTRAPSYFIF